MSPNVLYGALVGLMFASGVLLVVAGLRGHRIRRQSRRGRFSVADRRRVFTAVGVAVGVGFITRWPVVAVGAGVAIWVWPKMFGGSRVGAHELERLEALAIWTESLRDTIAGAISLEQAIPASLDAAPPLLREPLGHLVGMLRTRVPLPEALTRFADDLDDAAADLVVAALILNARLRGPGLEATLSELATHAREELEHRQLVEAGRKSLHRSARVIVGVTVAFAAALAVFSRQYVEPYSTPAGQVVLAGVIAIFGVALMRLRKLAEYKTPARFLAHRTASTTGPAGAIG
jgi:tight adherence protein B